jgi:type VI secretion system protein ImpG
MFDELHAYYNRELGYLRKLAAEFAEQHPKIAGRLRLSGEAADDPHVERLLQGFAFIAARIHRKLDDDFPELTQGLLEILYPHYLAPIPSMAVIELAARPDLTSPLEVKPGTLIDAGPVQGDTCRFRTAYPVTLWPIQIEAVSLRGRRRRGAAVELAVRRRGDDAVAARTRAPAVFHPPAIAACLQTVRDHPQSFGLNRPRRPPGRPGAGHMLRRQYSRRRV